MKWEYKVVKVPVYGLLKPNVNPSVIEHILNDFGQRGWEHVTTTSITTGNGSTMEIVLSFKRTIPDSSQFPSVPPPLP